MGKTVFPTARTGVSDSRSGAIRAPTELHDNLSEWWGSTPWTKGRSLTKTVDSTLSWSIDRDLHSIHMNEYRDPEDVEVRER